ncbi:methyl-accepting chemotaxis sensory transducer with Cache sensor [Anoxybacillus pushchinoensis]|jgi:methyl-accepting chemotaxis protein|uniref:Methyl-accepting chemotaxis sensory transducer with Cache sensor n=1 Tax=Anoxybacillus pushchinoensis TaxID=150248 RepID=A0A1I0SSL2_9BACL|nr:methyl-accepting chemotaxis protein [Anoxybacillus pushchinoensis]SFA42481.1 methyl-accepting chemotaxis sensory transducer with Cache sensor [Anoxybacillus pushchinoensis]
MFLLKKGRRKEEVKETKQSVALNQIEVAADQLKAVVEQMKLAASSLDETSSATQQSTFQLIDRLEKTVIYTVQVEEKTKMIERSALKISDVSQRIHADSEVSYNELIRSLHSLKNLQREMDDLRTGHYALLRQMELLVERSQEIHHILSTIASISQRTSILALNANIESARAGEHGKGFSVVANEVGKLANQTSAAVEQTRDILSSIQSGIASTMHMVKSETEQIDNGSNEMNHIFSVLCDFRERLHHMTAMAHDSSQSVDEQTASVQEISVLLEYISSMVQENKNHAHEVAKHMDVQHENVKQVLQVNEAIEKTSNELQTIIKNDERVTATFVDLHVIEQMKEKLTLFLRSYPLARLQTSEHEAYLNEFLKMNENVEAVWSNRVDGTFIYSNPPAGLVNAKARPWFVEAAKGNIYVSSVYISALTKRPCLTISAPIVQDGHVVGVVGIDLSV